MSNIEASELSVIVSFSLSLILGIAFYFRDKNINETARIIKYILITSRFFCLFILLFLLFGPLVISKNENKIEPSIIALVDDSKSLSIVDTLVQSRITKKLDDLSKAVNGKSKLKVYSFSEYAKLKDSLVFEGESTNIQNAFYTTSDLHQNENISSIVLFSDGIINSGGTELSNPLNVPVYSIGLGDTSKVKDAVVKSLYYNDISYTGNSFPIQIGCVVNNMKNVQQRLIVKYENSIVLDSLILPASNKFFIKCNQLIKANSEGVKSIEVKLTNKEAEKTLENNSLKRFVKILDNRQEIAFVYETPHPDVRALKSVFKGDENYEMDNFKYSQKCPAIQKYNTLVFIGGGDKADVHRWYSLAKEKGVNCLWLTGLNSSFSTEDFSLNQLDASKDEAHLAIQDGFSLFKVDNKLNEFLKSTSPLSVPFGKWRIKNINQSLAVQQINGVETNYPLITFASNEKVRNAFVLGEGVWRWKLKEEGEVSQFNNLFRRIIQYLSVKEDKSSFRVKVESILTNRDDAVVEVEYYNPSFELENSEDLELELVNSDGEAFKYQFLKVGGKYRINLGVLKPDKYVIKTSKIIDGKKVDKVVPVVVEGNSLESFDLVANHEILKSLSKSSKGKFFHENDYNSFLGDISLDKNYKTLRYSEALKKELIRNKWLLFILIALLAIEWFVRKWEGIV